ncbi:MAG: bifunctional methylenetetrahydrofolate dehydrogenase/methenyltetrahydrofolate cyclohydrolase FolD [Alphaproteobacteria bacterium]|nr:bifunctional methylenetetrahydrofolate dehydrogenase/methenyltetrahydrofolate cyclohydrolase FolD [Alphaproteobacteria bacterium]MCY4320585.1 bifunctional methylenetetrahydrofolate dehydrogenase/methenyltetrahydrofolate cyclohydrolase FolD [Alphaproteobacteria bacterium]
MSNARIIDGKALAAVLRARVAAQVSALQGTIRPGLAVVLVGDDPASAVYVRNKNRETEAAGMASFEHRLPADTGEAGLLALVDSLNRDPSVHGILVQLPLPEGIDSARVLRAIDPAKDVDGFHPENVGALWTGAPALAPCTPRGCMAMLAEVHPDGLRGKRAVVVGRSNIVGKPMAALLLAQHCTVTLSHSRTQNLSGVCREADILVAAVGRPRMIEGSWVRPGATVIDVGINRVTTEGGGTRLIGDVDFAGAAAVAGAITPVPGGVGPMTIASLLANTVTAACRQAGVAEPEVRAQQ